MKLRALVFEDDDAIRKLVVATLKSRGYEVYDFPDPCVCELVHSDTCECPEGMQCTDIIISDRMLNKGDGIKLLKKQIERGCKARFMAIMSSAMSPVENDWLTKHGVRIYHKPFPLGDLAGWLDECEEQTEPERKLIPVDSNGRPVPPPA